MEPRPSLLQVWWLAARPKTLWAGVAPVLLGTALAAGDGRSDLRYAFVALFCSILIQIATNFWNDYADFVRGADHPGRVGPTRATQAGWIRPVVMRNVSLLTFALAGLLSLLLVSRAGWPLAVVGAVSILSGLAYTGGPRPLAYIGLGDLFVLIFFGPVAVAGTYYVQTLEWSTHAAIAGIGPGFISVAILVVNNLRDIVTDKAAGKRTLAVRLGPLFARLQYTACLAVAGLIPLSLYWMGAAGQNVAWSGLSVLGGWRALLRVWFHEGADLNPALAQTALLLLLYSVMFSAGWIL